MDNIRERLMTGLGLQGTGTELIIHPSGTDAEYIPLLYAQQRAEALGCPRVVNVIAAAGEVGSHTATAAQGLHISNVLPLGGQCELRQPVDGFNSQKIKVLEVLPRDGAGGLVQNYDAAMRAAVIEAEEEEDGAFYILHAALSKTGLLMPSHCEIEELERRFQGRLVLVFDACQLRASAQEVKYWICKDAIILITGSKFYGGPGFCGAVVCPPTVTKELATNTNVPAGLSSYLCKPDVPRCMHALHNALADPAMNVGVALRWVCALTEMEAFNRYQALYLSKMASWVTGVRNAVSSYAPYLELLGDEGQQEDGHMGGWNTIIGVKMSVQGMGELTLNDLKRVHVLMRKDLSREMPPAATDEEKAAVRLRCFIGQPVWLGCMGIMRIALGAPNTRSWHTVDGAEQSLQEDRVLLQKWATIAKYFRELSC